MLIDLYQNERNLLTELGHSDRLKIHVNLAKFTSNLAFKSIHSLKPLHP